MEKKCLVLFSNGLDSRLAVKIMQDREYSVTALFFKFPFSKDAEKEVEEFAKKNKVKLKLLDCTKGKLLQEYLKVIRNAKFGRGVGINPCVDCKIFMLKKAKKYARENKIDFVATGEVEGQRPMSQTKSRMNFIEEKSGLKSKMIRPLSEFGISGRRRDKQIELAKKFKIKYPHPAGGCLLCEKELKKRLKYLLERGLDSEEIKLVNIGRHFKIKDCWIVVGRDAGESKIIDGFKSSVKSDKGKPGVYYSKKNCGKFASELQDAYRTGASEKERKKFDKWKL